MDTRPGIKTSEFLLSLLAIVVGALPSWELIPTDSVVLKVAGLAGAALAALGYTVGRSLVKLGVSREQAARISSAPPGPGR